MGVGSVEHLTMSERTVQSGTRRKQHRMVNPVRVRHKIGGKLLIRETVVNGTSGVKVSE